MKPSVRPLSWCAWSICALLACALSAGAQSAGDSPLEALRAAIEQAREAQVDALAPTSFEAALREYEVAMRDAERGRNPERIRKRVDAGMALLDKADAAARSARQVLSGVIRTRDEALSAQAPRYAPEEWARAAAKFRDAMLQIERNNIQNAQRRAAEAEVLLRQVELTAIKTATLDEARALIAQAEAARVERVAPRSLNAARRYLARAEQEIQRNRYDLSVPEELAAQASYEARHALEIARVIERVSRNKDAGLEALILEWEAPVKDIAAEMNVPARFDQGLLVPLGEMLEYARQQRQELVRLRQELEDRNGQIEALNAEVQRLESRLGGVSEERLALQRRVIAQERLRANVAAVESAFTSTEARVYRQGDDVVISLVGIRFPPGRSTIDAAASALLKKVQEAINLFPGASLVVEGHTDSSGSDSANLILSQDRADAVRQHLVDALGLDPEKVSSVGYGESRPVASNETAAGRARNRRIDLIIHVDPIR